MTERCDCCDLLVSQCGKAKEDQQRRELAAQRRWLLDHGWIPATWAGFCVRCGEHFEPNTAISSRIGPGGVVGWVAECCVGPVQL